MVEFALENLTGKLAGEIESLAEAHGQEFTYWKEVKGPVKIAWAEYFRAEAQGNLAIATARDSHRLVGYFVITSGQLLHYASIREVRDDTFYLAPEYRGSSVGFRFVAFAVACMEQTKVPILRVVNKAKADYARMWQKLGFTAEEIHYTKVNPNG